MMARRINLDQKGKRTSGKEASGDVSSSWLKDSLQKIVDSSKRPEIPTGTLWVIAGFSFMYLFLCWQSPWWRANMVNWWTLWVAVGFTMFGLMLESKKSFKPRLGKYGLIFMILVVGWKFYGETWTSEVDAKPTDIRLPAFGLPIKYNEAGHKTVSDFWIERLRLDQDGAREMIAIAERESQFNQFEADGTTPLRGRVNPRDVGVMQINEDYWLPQAKALGFNIYAMEGNLNMAHWIRQHFGADEWNTSDEVRMFNRQKEFTVIAPAEGWSEVVVIPADTRLSCDTDVAVMDNKGVEYRKPGPIDLGDQIKSMKFQSKTGEEVAIKCKFSPL